MKTTMCGFIMILLTLYGRKKRFLVSELKHESYFLSEKKKEKAFKITCRLMIFRTFN